jgi:Fatty acid hydroxylase superfamily
MPSSTMVVYSVQARLRQRLFFGLCAIVCCVNAFLPQERCVSVALKSAGSFPDDLSSVSSILNKARAPAAALKKQHQRSKRSLVLQKSTRRSESNVSPFGEPVVPTTLRQALNVFFGSIYHGPRTIAASLVGLVTCRGMLVNTSFSLMEAGVAFSMVLFWCLQEHFLHQRLLHSTKDWPGKRIHQGHHDRDYFHVSIDPAPLMISWMTIVGISFFYLLPTHELALTATIAYASAGLWYEWTHFIVHTKVRFPKNSYFDTCKTHHARHHLVNSNHWFAFSYPGVDDWFGTNPSVEAARNEAKHANGSDELGRAI